MKRALTVLVLALVPLAGCSDGRSVSTAAAVPRPVPENETVASIRRAAEQGDARAQSQLGIMYRDGHDVPQDDGQALAWIQKAADQGFAEAQSILGELYDHGQGAPLDDALSVAWTRKAADQGFAAAMYNLSQKYLKGRGVRPDPIEGCKWLALAAERAPESLPNHIAANGESVATFGTRKDYNDARETLAKSMSARDVVAATQRSAEWTAALDKRQASIGAAR